MELVIWSRKKLLAIGHHAAQTAHRTTDLVELGFFLLKRASSALRDKTHLRGFEDIVTAKIVNRLTKHK